MRMACIALLVVALTGCGVELLATTAIHSELQKEQLQGLKGQISDTKDFSSTLSVQQAINAYRAEKGQNPPSLDALVPEWMPSVPKQASGQPFYYNPATGELSEKPFPAAPAMAQASANVAANPAADLATIDTIRRAIDKFGQATGYYPGSLDVLVPYYLAGVPKTSAGQDFLYDPQTGVVSAPPAGFRPAAPTYQAQQVRPRSGGAGGAGAGGPMGEAMTGIAIQSELNNMSSAGTSAASSRMREKARNLGQGDQRNEAAMNDLGL